MGCGTETRVHDKLIRRQSREATRLPGLFTAGAGAGIHMEREEAGPLPHSSYKTNGCSETGRDLGPLDTGLIPGPTCPRATKEQEGTKRDRVHGHLGPGMDMKTQKGWNTAARAKTAPSHEPCVQSQQRGRPSKLPAGRPTHRSTPSPTEGTSSPHLGANMGPYCLCPLPPPEAGAPVKPCLDSSSGRVSTSTIKESRSPGWQQQDLE